jgi:hypothetical protein
LPWFDDFGFLGWPCEDVVVVDCVGATVAAVVVVVVVTAQAPSVSP